jgi:hypothetical protein
VKNIINFTEASSKEKKERCITADNEIADHLVKDLIKAKAADIYYERD